MIMLTGNVATILCQAHSYMSGSRDYRNLNLEDNNARPLRENKAEMHEGNRVHWRYEQPMEQLGTLSRELKI